MTVTQSIRLDHLDRLCNERGIFEHAKFTTPRLQHGYCTDDNARLLLVMGREPYVADAARLCNVSLRFVMHSIDKAGGVHNRMNQAGEWSDSPSTADCWGRAVWALGAVGATHVDPLVRATARDGFDQLATQTSGWLHAMAFAALGAAEVLTVEPSHGPAVALLERFLVMVDAPISDAWCWPVVRLSYANASLAEAVIAAGTALGRPHATQQGRDMLGWLIDLETRGGHLSVTGTSGRGPGDRHPQFDQQPIEVAAIADAAWRMSSLDDDPRWLNTVMLAANWFYGNNDSKLVMFDQKSGGGYDGLGEQHVNQNQGAESTLAFVSTMQRFAQIGGAR